MSKKLSINNLSVAASLLISFSVAIDLGTWVYSQSESPIFVLKLSSAVFSALGYMLAGLVFGHLTTKAYETKGFWLATLPFAGVMAVFYVGFSNVHGIARYIILLEPILYIGSGIATYLYGDQVTVTVEMVSKLKDRVKGLTSEKEGLTKQCQAMSNDVKVMTSSTESLSSENIILTKQIESMSSENTILTKRIEVLSSENTILTNDVKVLTSSTESLSSDVKTLTSQNEVLTKRIEVLASSTESLSSELREVKSKNTRLTKQLSGTDWIHKAPMPLLAIAKDYATIGKLNGSKDKFGISGTDEKHIARIASKELKV